jgi:multimeric flavodoxin WrbA
MNYLIINGSPRKGNTYKIITQIKSRLEGNNIEEIHLSDIEIPFCLGCQNCILKGETYCPHHDKVKGVLDKIRACDGLIISSPVYALNVSAILKNLIDHTSYLFHRPEFFTKKALVVVSAAGTGQKDVSKYVDETLRHWGFNKIYKIAVAIGDKEEIESKDIDETSEKFIEDVEKGKLHSPKFGDIIFYNVWKAMALIEKPIEIDKKYWFDTGLINYDFAPEVRLGIVKKLFSKIMFNILKRVIK